MCAKAHQHAYWVYILASRRNGTLYVGVTNSIERRVWQHKTGQLAGFTRQYRVTQLVHCEHFRDVNDAIGREKQLKSWLRRRKLALIETGNPDWNDLSAGWYDSPLDSSLRSE